MTEFRRVHKKIDWSPEDRTRHKAIREQFKDKPSLEALEARGELSGPVSHGVTLTLMQMMAALKQLREQAGLSLADVSDKTGMDRAAISRLENGKQLNPTLDTLGRYAAALGKQLQFSVVDAPTV